LPVEQVFYCSKIDGKKNIGAQQCQMRFYMMLQIKSLGLQIRINLIYWRCKNQIIRLAIQQIMMIVKNRNVEIKTSKMADG